MQRGEARICWLAWSGELRLQGFDLGFQGSGVRLVPLDDRLDMVDVGNVNAD